MRWEERYADKRMSAADAVQLIGPGQNIFISSGAAEPITLVEQLVEQADRFNGNTIVHLLTLGPAPYVEPAYEKNFRHKAFFIGPNVRKAVHEGRVDYTPVFLSQIPYLIRSRRMPVDVALIQVTPPDASGFVNLGVSVDIVLSAVQSAQLVIAQVNPEMPVVHGYGYIPMQSIDAWFIDSRPLPEVKPAPLDDIAKEIGRNVAGLVENGATLQMGIGQIPDAVLKELHRHYDLGIWTEMFSDGVIDLIENGNINGRLCTTNPDRVTSSFTFGSKRLYDFVDSNPMFMFGPSNKINDPREIARQHKIVAVNSALQVDLSGQVCADSIGGQFYSGIGGQVDFIRGASMCKGGKPIIALRSTAKRGTLSRIVPVLDEGAGVVTSRGDVEYVVTEYGVVDLKGRSVRARALALAGIAHPEFREELLAAARARKYIPLTPVDKSTAQTTLGKFERQIACDDGRKVLLRIATAKDEQALQTYMTAIEATQNYRDWTRAAPNRLPSRIESLADANPAATFNAIAVHGTQIVGLAHANCDQAEIEAEIALYVDESWRRHSIGGALLSLLSEIGRTKGIRRFTTWLLPRHHVLLQVLHSLGLPVHSQLRNGYYQVYIELPHRDRRRTQESAAVPPPRD